MKFAINYSPQAAELVQEGAIDIDLFKCADWQELIEPAMKLKPAYVHFPLGLGSRTRKQAEWDMVQHWKDRTGTKYVNAHLGATSADYPDIPLKSRDKDHEELVVSRFLEDAQRLVDRFGKDTLIIENLPTDFTRTDESPCLRISVDPSIVRRIIEHVDCGLLLDIDHARVSSLALGMDFRDYIAQLPVHRLKELHMTGTHLYEGHWRSHFEMREEDWKIFDWALEQIRSGAWAHPEIFAFEYGGIGPKFDWKTDKELIAQQVPEFRNKMLKAGI
jgi:uncharacterized protein